MDLLGWFLMSLGMECVACKREFSPPPRIFIPNILLPLVLI